LSLRQHRILHLVSSSRAPKTGRQRTPIDPESRIYGRHTASAREKKKEWQDRKVERILRSSTTLLVKSRVTLKIEVRPVVLALTFWDDKAPSE
jgi:hypothetical protein